MSHGGADHARPAFAPPQTRSALLREQVGDERFGDRVLRAPRLASSTSGTSFMRMANASGGARARPRSRPGTTRPPACPSWRARSAPRGRLPCGAPTVPSAPASASEPTKSAAKRKSLYAAAQQRHQLRGREAVRVVEPRAVGHLVVRLRGCRAVEERRHRVDALLPGARAGRPSRRPASSGAARP